MCASPTRTSNRRTRERELREWGEKLGYDVDRVYNETRGARSSVRDLLLGLARRRLRHRRDHRRDGGNLARVRRKSIGCAILILLSSLVPGCALPTFRNYDTSVLSDQQAATVRNHVWLGGCAGCVQRISTPDATIVYSKERDGRVAEFRLVPGTYAVRYLYSQPSYCHGQTYGVADRTDTLDLESGHVYQIRLEPNEWVARCGAVRRYLSNPRLWIEDETTNRVVAGDKEGRGRPQLTPRPSWRQRRYVGSEPHHVLVELDPSGVEETCSHRILGAYPTIPRSDDNKDAVIAPISLCPNRGKGADFVLISGRYTPRGRPDHLTTSEHSGAAAKPTAPADTGHRPQRPRATDVAWRAQGGEGHRAGDTAR